MENWNKGPIIQLSHARTVIRPAIRVQVSSALRWYLCIICYKIEYITAYDYPANNETKLCLRCMAAICRHCRQRISVKNMSQNC